MTGACSSWLGRHDLPAMGVIFIYELAANSGSSSIAQAPNLHFGDPDVNQSYGKIGLNSLVLRSKVVQVGKNQMIIQGRH